MRPDRREFLSAALAVAAVSQGRASARGDGTRAVSNEELLRVAEEPVLREDLLGEPVAIASMELLRNGREFLVRVRSRRGDEGISVANSMHLIHTYPIFLNRVAPFFVGKDARRLEPLLWDLYRQGDNYKYQGLAFWVCVAAAEFAVLDLLGKRVGRPIGDLLGGVRRHDIPVYRASGNRGNTPEEEIVYLKKIVEESGARALKFRVGGRMSKNADDPAGRTEALIPLVRQTFGPEMTIYADSNSSYDVSNAIRVGRLMEEQKFAFFEEPCRFDHLEDTKAVADALSIPIAWGEQEFSEAGFRWMIQHRGLEIVQPDLHYHGGFIRSMRVARMAAAAGMTCTPHMSGSGLGFLDMAHFVSCLPNPSPFHEFKGDTSIPVTSATSPLKSVNGVVRVPSGPGYGVTIDDAFLRECHLVKAI